MDILDAIKKSVLEQFNTTVTVDMILISLLVAFVIGLFIVIVYKKTFSGVVYNRSIVLTIILLAMITAMIIRTINSNLSLSLGMVGALSIVRFRTAIKDPTDTAFMFWAITAGIMSGAGLYVIAIVAALIIGVLYYLSFTFYLKPKNQYLLVVVYQQDKKEMVDGILNVLSKKQLKSKSLNANGFIECTYQLPLDKNVDEVMNKLHGLEGVRSVNLVTYSNDYGL